MKRIVFQLAGSLGPDDQPFLSISLEEPEVFGSKSRPFTCTADDPAFTALRAAVLGQNSISFAGNRLFAAVATHQELQQRLQAALLTTAEGDRYPVYVKIATPDGAEALPWEAMCSPGGDYLGLDSRWALARIVNPDTEPRDFYTFRPPLRIAAVLSCLGISAAGELTALREAVAAQAGSAELLVITSEKQLFAGLQADIAAGLAPGVAAVHLIPPELDDLQEIVADFEPHVLHLFCHGSSENTPHVSLARASDWQMAQPTSGLLAEAGDFRGFTRSTDALPWLIVLNCCEGAAAGTGADTKSLTLDIALRGIAPAVIGMREPIVSGTANLLTGALYKRLIAEVSTRSGQAGAQPLDWAHLVAAVRDRLVRATGMPPSVAAASTKEWTMPVLYVSPGAFKLQVQQPAPAYRGGWRGLTKGGSPRVPGRAERLEIEALRTMLGSLPPDQGAAALRAEAEGRIAELTRRLGVFQSPPELAR